MGCPARILHIDMDAFFVSVERLHDPSLRGRPVAVGHPGPRGVVASASYEARAFGVRSAMPSSRARLLCPELVFVRGRHGGYGEHSKLVRRLLETYSPAVEAASIDEFFLDLTGCQRLHGDFLDMATRIGTRIQGELGLPSSLGIGANRTLAKIASKMAKPRGVLEVLAGGEADFMAPLPAGLIPGVGPVVRQQLARMGIVTAGQLARVPPRLLEKALGAWGPEVRLKAMGQWRGSGTHRIGGPLSIGHETTFPEDTADPAVLEARLFSLVERGASRLRAKGLEAKRVTVKVRYSDFSTRSRTAPMQPASLERDIWGKALFLLRNLTSRRLRVRLVGVTLSCLSTEGCQQDLFRCRDEKRLAASECLDRLRKRFGYEAAGWAAGVAPVIRLDPGPA